MSYGGVSLPSFSRAPLKSNHRHVQTAVWLGHRPRGPVAMETPPFCDFGLFPPPV